MLQLLTPRDHQTTTKAERFFAILTPKKKKRKQNYHHSKKRKKEKKRKRSLYSFAPIPPIALRPEGTDPKVPFGKMPKNFG